MKMAEGGFRRRKSRRSINIGSDVLYDFACTPCAKNSINEEAEMKCVECREYFCVSCFKDHNKFDIMRNHQILNNVEMLAQGPQQTPTVLTQRCQDHHGNTIDTYCPVHQEVGCITCIHVAQKHALCKGKAYIPMVAQGFKNSEEYKNMKPSIESSIQQLRVFKTTIQTDLKDLHQEKDVALRDIKDYRKDIEMELDRMEKKVTEEVNAKYKIIQAGVKAHMKYIEDMMSTLESILENIKVENEAELFIHVKDGNIKMAESKVLLQHLNDEIPGREILQFKESLAINECMKKNEKLGELLLHKLCSISLTGEYNVNVKTDTGACNISGCTFLDDRTPLITDFKNKKIKRLNSSFQVTEFCDFPSAPQGLCVTDNKEVAVALPYVKKVQFVSIGKQMKLSRSFTTMNMCKGLAYSNKNIIVSNFQHNDVHIYSENGQCLRTITFDKSYLDTKHKNSFPRIALSTDQSKLHILNENKDVISLSMKDGHNNWVCTGQMVSAFGLCVLENNNILVADMGSNKIFEITGDGHMLGAVVQRKDVVEKPVCVCVDKANSRLIISSWESNKIKVFKMN